MDACTSIMDRLAAADIRPVCVLIIPSGDWTAAHLATLRAWQAAGDVLAAHGWAHVAPPPRTLHHRLHSLLFSRDAAEHLSRTNADLHRIVDAGLQWFAEAGLQPPRLYVPPAWALGDYALSEFDAAPFDFVETLTGIYSVRSKHMTRLPLVGFEADTAIRAWTLRALNAANRILARITGRPLRVAIHPNDLHLRLSDDVQRLLRHRQAVVPLQSLRP